MIAALFVDPSGPYFGRYDVDAWDEARDARNYRGPHPVVAHPPCQRWGRYWSGGPSAKVRRKLGDDEGCFAAALESVRKWGGVLEHPEASHAFRVFGLPIPPKSGGWIGRPYHWACCVEQGHYGHRARKATWLYAVTADKPPGLIWGKAEGKCRMDGGFPSTAARRAAVADGWRAVEHLSKSERLLTPKTFAELLISIVDNSYRGTIV